MSEIHGIRDVIRQAQASDPRDIFDLNIGWVTARTLRATLTVRAALHGMQQAGADVEWQEQRRLLGGTTFAGITVAGTPRQILPFLYLITGVTRG